MKNQTGFIFKVLIISLLLSVVIKYVGPYLNIPLTAQIVLIIVPLPSIILGIALLWRYQQQQKTNSQQIN